MKISDIKFKKEFYPREGLDNETVSLYRLNLDNLPPILLNKDKILIDGYHRLTAHKLEKRNEIKVEFLSLKEEEIFLEAIKRNSIFGKQLTNKEKRNASIKLYKSGIKNQVELGKILGVSQQIISRWIADIKHIEDEERTEKILQLYLSCKTETEIAKEVGCSQQAISKILKEITTEISSNTEFGKSCNPQIYDVWNFGKLDNKYGMDYPGRIPGQFIENILYYFTKPFDIVVDPMAGGGTTIDVCKTYFRRWQAYDIEPVREDIVKHNIRNGFPEKARNCDLIFLDPPYWKKKEKEYPKNSISRLDKEEYLKFFRELIPMCKKALNQNGHLAFLMSNYIDYDKPENSIFAADYFKIFRENNFVPIYEIQCPLSTEQYSGYDVERAKKEKKLLIISRSLYIYGKIRSK